jgi:Domain of unknown function (DUF1883)
MQFIHAREYVINGQAVKINCDRECRVMLTTDGEYDNFRKRRDYIYQGSLYRLFPVVLTPPHSGFWNITLDLGDDYTATIQYSIDVIKPRSDIHQTLRDERITNEPSNDLA